MRLHGADRRAVKLMKTMSNSVASSVNSSALFQAMKQHEHVRLSIQQVSIFYRLTILITNDCLGPMPPTPNRIESATQYVCVKITDIDVVEGITEQVVSMARGKGSTVREFDYVNSIKRHGQSQPLKVDFHVSILSLPFDLH